jgi:hypothetical protein
MKYQILQQRHIGTAPGWHWSRAGKDRIVAAAIEPGAIVSEVARAVGIHTSQLFELRGRGKIPIVFNPYRAPLNANPMAQWGDKASPRLCHISITTLKV